MTVIARSLARPSLFLALSLLALAACGGGGGRANISAGTMPAGGTFTGVWSSPQYGEMHMVQTGVQVVAEYTKDERRGRIQGTVQGDLLRFEWSERRELVAGRPITTRGRGYFRFVAGDDHQMYIVGEWGHDDNETGGGPWRAVRSPRRRPSLSGGGSGGTSSGGEEGGGAEEGDSLDGPTGGGGGYDSGSSSGSGSSGSDDLGDL